MMLSPLQNVVNSECRKKSCESPKTHGDRKTAPRQKQGRLSIGFDNQRGVAEIKPASNDVGSQTTDKRLRSCGLPANSICPGTNLELVGEDFIAKFLATWLREIAMTPFGAPVSKAKMSFEGARLQPCRKYPIKINGFSRRGSAS
jgi:hypothetical protein